MKFATIIALLFGTYEGIPAVVVNDEGQGLIRGPPTSGVVIGGRGEGESLFGTYEDIPAVVVNDVFATVALKMGGRGEGGKTPADPTVDFLHISEKNNCDINTNALMYDTDVSKKMNSAVNGDGYFGILARQRYDCDDPHGGPSFPCTYCGGNKGPAGSELCGVAATYLNNDIIAPNPVYNLEPPDRNKIAKTAAVMYAFVDAWSMHPDHHDGDGIQAYAYYPADSNSNDERDWEVTSGIPGRGCKSDQNFVYNKDSSKIGDSGYASVDTDDCKCNYNAYDQTLWGNLVYESTTDKNNPKHRGFGAPDEVQWNKKHPAFWAQDASSCWVQEWDFHHAKEGYANMNLIIDAQNSLYNTRGTWWNGGVGGGNSGDTGTYSYQGHNEVSVSADMDDINKFYPEAFIIVLPTGLDNICDLDNNGLAQSIDDDLNKYWSEGYSPPVVTMKTYDNGGEKFRKYFIAQDFKFTSGNCIKKIPGASEAYYYAGPGKKNC